MKKLIAIAATFIFIYPVFLKFLPIPLDRVLQLCGMVVLSFNSQDLGRLFNAKVLWKFFGVTFVLLLLAFVAHFQLRSGFDLFFFKEVLDTFLNVFSAYFVCWTVRNAYGYVSLGLVLYHIVVAAIIQTFISFAFFFNNSFFDAYVSILKEETNQGLLNRTSSIGRRFMGFGSQFFTGVLKYGIAFFGILMLPYMYKKGFVQNSWVYWFCVVLVAIGGIFTGRTFFAAFLLAILLLLMFKSKNMVSFIVNNIKAVVLIVISGIIVGAIASVIIESERLEAVYSFAFELFINFFENDSLETNSTNHMSEMYFFPDNINTWLFGDGRMQADKGYYMGTDIGYIRLIFYFGLPSTLFFIYLLYIYYKILAKYAVAEEVRYLVLFVMLWTLILNFKGLAFMTEYFVVMLVCLLLSKRTNFATI